MVNAKKIYSQLLSNARILEIVPEENISNSYPSLISQFPCIIFIDDNQNDIEYADNKSLGTNCSVSMHVFSKKINGYPTTSEIAEAITEVMNNDFWNCSSNGEVSDPQQDVEHRVLNFNKSILY